MRTENGRGDTKYVMTKKLEPEVTNPRYQGATPEMVARALLRQREPDEKPESVREPGPEAVHVLE